MARRDRLFARFARFLGIGAMYGVGYAIIKGLFPQPFLLLVGQGGDLTRIAAVYMLTGLLAGIIGGPLFGALLLLRGGEVLRGPDPPQRIGLALGLSFGFALLIGLISGLLVFGAHFSGILPSNSAVDPVGLIRSSNFPPGIPLLIAWTFAWEILPAMLTGLLLAPFGGNSLYRLYTANRPAPQSRSFEDY